MVAKIAARLFPVARPFIRQVIDEGLVPKEEFRLGPYPNDTLAYRSDTEVEFLTPGNSEGMGTSGMFAMNEQPISGVVILLPEYDMDVVVLDIRLPPEMRGLSTTIVATVKANQGTPIFDRPR
jgi:hypothetical protein